MPSSVKASERQKLKGKYFSSRVYFSPPPDPGREALSVEQNPAEWQEAKNEKQ